MALSPTSSTGVKPDAKRQQALCLAQSIKSQATGLSSRVETADILAKLMLLISGDFDCFLFTKWDRRSDNVVARELKR